MSIPATSPVRIPLAVPIIEITCEELLHIPPVTESLNVTEWPEHTDGLPLILDGIIFTVIILEIIQPVPIV